MDAQEIARRAGALYGEPDWRAAEGVLHVAAIASETGLVIAIGPDAPPSATDRFALGLARARADAILTTGAILRAEPDLVHRYAETEAEDAAFGQWRQHALGRGTPPELLVLSASGSFPTDHPAIRAAASGRVFTSAAGRERLGARVGSLVVETVAGIAEAVAAARRLPGLRTLALEAGPRAAAPLYESGAPTGAAVDELLLSRFEGKLAAEAEGPAFVAEERIRARLHDPISSARVDEPSGPWRFERYRRDPESAG